jgi:hypothetical protein
MSPLAAHILCPIPGMLAKMNYALNTSAKISA